MFFSERNSAATSGEEATGQQDVISHIDVCIFLKKVQNENIPEGKILKNKRIVNLFFEFYPEPPACSW